MPTPEHEANRLRAELRRRHYPGADGLTHPELVRLAMKVTTAGGDIDLAATAVLQWPRPAWVADIIGPGQMPDLEMLHPDDVATEGNW